MLENLCYGSLEHATPASAKAAATTANAHEFISAFTDGYDTIVGERGVRVLSHHTRSPMAHPLHPRQSLHRQLCGRRSSGSAARELCRAPLTRTAIRVAPRR